MFLEINLDLYNIPIGEVKKLVCSFFDKENYALLETTIRIKKYIYSVLEFNQSQLLKPYIELSP